MVLTVLFIGAPGLLELPLVKVNIAQGHQDRTYLRADISFHFLCQLQSIQQELLSFSAIRLTFLFPLQGLHSIVTSQCLQQFRLNLCIFSSILFFLHDFDSCLEHVLSLLKLLEFRLYLSWVNKHLGILGWIGSIYSKLAITYFPIISTLYSWKALA